MDDTKPGDFSFNPSALIRNRHVQSILASSHWRPLGGNSVVSNAQEIITSTTYGSRLLSYLTPHAASRGLIIILHGWEGSSSSAYVVSTGNFFYSRGFSVCRVNLRDHGTSHHLNEGLFHGALLDETLETVSQLAAMAGDAPVYLIGFSLGANFALRIGRKHSETPVPGLQHVFAVSPPLDPYKATLSIDNGWVVYRKYFLRKWKKSLLNKQRIFPDKYDFRKQMREKTCIGLTAGIMHYLPDFPSYMDYFNLYTLKNDFFQHFQVPVTVIIAEDDPVIPLEDFDGLQENDFFHISRQKFGGHCGFLDLFPLHCWFQEKIAAMIL